SRNNYTGYFRSLPGIPIIMNSLMAEKLKNIRIVGVALLIAVALAAVADFLYFSDLEWRYRTSCVDARLTSLENDAEKLLRTAEKQISDAGDPSSLFHSTLGSNALKKG